MSANEQPLGPGHRALVRETRNTRVLAHELVDQIPDDGALDELVETLDANHKLRSGGDA